MRSKDVELAEKLGEKSKEYYSLNNVECMYLDEIDFAKKSQFHGKIMEDGYVFNPYIHRRWLPARYKEMLNKLKVYGIPIEGTIQADYDRLYPINVTIDEMRKLDFLRKADQSAYDERKKFFTIGVIKKILLREMNNILIYSSDEHNGYGRKHYTGEMHYFLRGFYEIGDSECEETVKLEKISNFFGTRYDEQSYIAPTGFLNKLRKRIALLENADTYYEISKAIKDIPINKLSLRGVYHDNGLVMGMSPYFVKAFHLAGAYYTLKNDIMFEHKEVNGLKGAEACAYIREMLDNGATADDFDQLLLR